MTQTEYSNGDLKVKYRYRTETQTETETESWLVETVRWELSRECVFLALGLVLRVVLAASEA